MYTCRYILTKRWWYILKQLNDMAFVKSHRARGYPEMAGIPSGQYST